MIKRERPYPLRLRKEEALLRSIPSKRPELISNIRKGKAGYRGLDYHLTFLPEDHFLIFNDLRLPYKDKFFQLDTLLLSPQTAIIIESKNIYGHLFFDPNTNQVIRTFNGKKEGFPDPILQAERHKIQFLTWISQFTTKPIPVHAFVSIGHTSTIVDTLPGNYHIFKKLFHAEHIPMQLLQHTPQNAQQLLTPYQIKKISDLLLQENTPQDAPILSTYQIPSSDLLLGVPCPECSTRPMNRIYGNWLCIKCNRSSTNAHTEPITDHLLIHGQITNSQCRKLLGLSQIHVVKRILKAMDLPYTGSSKTRVYFLPT